MLLPLVVLAPILAVINLVATSQDFESTAAVHWMMQITSGVMLAFCAIAVFRGRAVRSESARKLIGAGLASAAVLDLCHGFLMMTASAPEQLELLVPWGWLPSRIILPLTFFLSIWIGVYEYRSQTPLNTLVIACSVITSIFTVACCIGMALYVDQLPSAYVSEGLVPRPIEIAPAVLFFLALLSYFYTGGWRHDVYQYNLLLSLAIAVIAHTLFMPFAQANFNHLFAAGVITKMLGYVLLVTAIVMQGREGMRVEAQREKRRHQAIVDTASDAIVTFDATGLIDTFNPAATRLFGYEANEAIGENITLLTPHELREPHAKYMKYVRSGRAPTTNAYSYEAIGLRKDGSTFPVESAINETQLGGLRLFTAIIRDITQRKAKQEDLLELSDRLTLALDVAHLGSWEMNLESDALTWNEQMFALYDRDPALGEPSQKEWLETTLQEDREACIAAHAEASKHGTPFDFVYRIKRPGGDIRWFKTNGRFIEKDSRHPRRLVGVNHDISDSILQMEELETARNEADDANRAKSAFLATMSHEIRTPLNGVIGLNEILQKTKLDNYQQDLANLIEQSANALLEIIEDVLDLSKIEAGKLDIDPTPTNPSEIVQDVCAMLTTLARQSDIELEISIDHDVPSQLLGDGKRTRQILTNLINNAIKFSSKLNREGRVSVTLRVEQDPIDSDSPQSVTWLSFIVKDNGVGMDKATLARLFNPFTQADASTSRQFGGTGLGLTISQRLAKLMGGEISVTSSVNEGSTFIASLPFAECSHADASGETAQKTTAPISITENQETSEDANAPYSRESAIADGKLILVAEDNPTNQQVIQHQLSVLGYYADVVEDGSVAFAAWRGGEYALVLTDLQMPETDGYELAKRIRAQEGPQQRIPIIAISANTLMDESEACLAIGMDAYLSKPASLDELEATISQWLPAGSA